MSHPEYSIEPYKHDHDAGLAQMWNESDQQWPGGFTQGVPFTTERIADWMDKQTTLVRLVVSAPDGAVVGYGSLWDEPSQPGRSAYVDLLNVHPDHQGYSLARRMLTQMVDYATEHGYERMTIGTWSANLKAVPLYKKVGFYWKPNTTVYMENYIPMLRRLPLLHDFFARGDWYTLHRRELAQSEDEQRHSKTGEMEVYISQWTNPSGATVEAVFDRKAQTLTGLETDDFAAHAQVGTSKPIQGLRYPITWEITNKRNTPLTVQLDAWGDEHVDIAHHQTMSINPEETERITAFFRCTADAPRLDMATWRPKPTPQIKSRLLLDGEELLLGSGVHYESAVELSLQPSTPTLTPGLSKRVLVQVKNQLDRRLEGTLRVVDAGGLTPSWHEQPISAEANGFASTALGLSCTHEMATELTLVATFVEEGEAISTAPKALAVLVRNVGSVAALLHQRDATKREIIAENDFFSLLGKQRAGGMWITNHAGQTYRIGLSEVIGPPYTPPEFDQRDYDLALQQINGCVHASFSIVSTRFPGLRVGREVIMTASPVVEVRQWLQNEGTITHVCKIQTTIDLPDSFDTPGQTAFSRHEGLITAQAGIMPEIEGDFPKQPAEISEQWVAYTLHGQTHGVVWGADISEHEWRPWFFDLDSAECTVLPQSRVTLSPFQLYCGPGDWRAVRRIWQQRTGQTDPVQLETRAMPVARAAQQVTVRPNPVLTLADNVHVQLEADNLRQQLLSGHLQITPPPGWVSDQTTVAVADLRQGQPVQNTLHLTAHHAPIGAATGQITLAGTDFDLTQPLTILRLGDAQQTVTVTQAQSQWTIDNGRMRWQVAPDFQAGLISWQEADSEINHLHTSYPEDGEFEWMKPWFGGLRPVLSSQESGWPGKLQRESFRVSPHEEDDTQGVRWCGVRLATAVQGQKTLKGLEVEIDYLTVPGSNLIKATLRVSNPTPIHRPAWDPSLSFMLFCQVDGRFDNAELYGESTYGGSIQRRRSNLSQWIRVGNWAAVVNPGSGRALTAVCASDPEAVALLNSGQAGGHLLMTQHKQLAPQSSNELVLYLALVDSLEQARGYQVLGAS